MRGPGDAWGVGGDTPRPDAAAKAQGEARYLADVPVSGMLHAALVASPVASARIRGIDTGPALKMEGVVSVLTARDVPGSNRIGLIYDDQTLFAEERVRMAGERLGIVVAETEDVALEAAAAVRADLEQTEGVYDVEHALDPKAPKVHPDGNLIHEFVMRRGDLESVVKRADLEIADTYRIGGQEHAYLEGQGCLAVPGPGPSLALYSSTQCPFYVRNRVARAAGVPQADIRVIQTVTGGGFGGKEDYPDEPACAAAVAALAVGRPVRLRLPRHQDFQVSSKRHRMVVRHRLYARKDGRVLGVRIEILVDAGAYAGLSTVVAERSNTSCVGPYAVEAVDVVTRVCYTNNLFGGPFRGFGAPQVSAAHEAQMNRLASELGADPVEVRRLNMVSAENPVFATGETLSQPHLGLETLDQAVKRSGLGEHRARLGPRKPLTGRIDPSKAESGRYREGVGVGTIIYGCNLHHGGLHLDRGGATVTVQADGTVNVHIGVTEMGQGALAAARAVASEALAVHPDRIRVGEVDTHTVADSGPTVASRATLTAGRAVIDAAGELMSRLRAVAGRMMGDVPADRIHVEREVFTDPESGRSVGYADVAAQLYKDRVNPVACGWFRAEERAYDAGTGCGRAYAFYCFATHVARVKVDTWTGQVRVLEVTAAHDVGRAVHPQSIEGQIHGGVVQGVGWSTLEEFVLHRGVLKNPGFTDYLIPTAVDAPEVNVVLVQEPEPQGPFGAKGIGEPSFIPCGSAVLGAVSDALGIHLTELPLTPERVRAAIVRAATGPAPDGGPRAEDGYLAHLKPPV